MGPIATDIYPRIRTMEALAIKLELRNSSAAGYRVTFTSPGKSLSWSKDTNYDALELIYKDLKQDFPDLCKLFPSTGKPDASAAVRSMERWLHHVTDPETFSLISEDIRGKLVIALSNPNEPESDLNTILIDTPTSKVVSGARSGIGSVQPETQELVLTFPESVLSMAALTDGRLVCAAGAAVYLYSSDGAHCERTLLHPKHVAALCVLPGDEIVSGSQDNALRIWDTTTGTCLKVLEGHALTIAAVCNLPGGRIVSASWDETLRVWDTTTGQCVMTLEKHSMAVCGVCVLDSNRIVSASWDETLCLWNLDTGKCLVVLEGHTATVSAVCALSNDRIVSASFDKTLRLWNTTTGESLGIWEGHADAVTAVCALSDNHVVSGSQDESLRVWDTKTGTSVKVLEGHTDAITSVCVLTNAGFMSGSCDGTLRFWNVVVEEHVEQEYSQTLVSVKDKRTSFRACCVLL